MTFNFKDIDDNWRIINDSVMGGKSQGSMSVNASENVFSGTISKENNGGFSSTYKSVEPLTSSISSVCIDVLGDGKTYQLRLITVNSGRRLAYTHEFLTVANQIQRYTFNLKDFSATFRGRILTNSPSLNVCDISEVGFLLSHHHKGSFHLSIFELNFL